MAYVLGVDIGTSSLRCVAVGRDGKVLAKHQLPVRVIHPTVDACEIDPEELWQSFKEVVKVTLRDASMTPAATCLGITTLRNTFMLWKRETGKPLCNFITWEDRRAAKDCESWNESARMKAIQAASSVLHFFTRSKKFLAASVISFITNMTSIRLHWLLNKLEGTREMAEKGDVCFGTVDTWIIWKLTEGKVHATDYSNISTSVLYDPYTMSWSNLMLSMLQIPKQMLPEIRDTGGDFGTCVPHLFGQGIPITGVISDQMSSAFAQMCWEPGDTKCTFGTGVFMTINTGSKVHTSITGLYPSIGWKIGDELVFFAEGIFSSVGSVVKWGEQLGLYTDPAHTEEAAMSVDSSGGVCFVPCFSGIQQPYNDPQCAASIIGLTYETRKEHITRAMLESFAFVCKQLFDLATSEIDHPVTSFRVDGGVSNNSFVMQLCSDLLGVPIQRPTTVDITVFGAVFVAGLSSGFWTSRDEVKEFWELERMFLPRTNGKTHEELQAAYSTWQKALERSLGWYET